MASRYGFLFSLRWLGMAVLGVVLVVACILLGNWQHGRYEERAATNDRIEAARHDSTPADVQELLPAGSAPSKDAEWRLITADGVYDSAGQVLIRNRTVNGEVGYEVVTPLVMADGTALLVDRGWVPASENSATELPDVPAPPDGTVTVVGQVRPGEGRIGDVDAVEGVAQARSINVDQLGDRLDMPVLGAYVTESEPADGLSAIPVTEERSWQNFAYSYQWWLFAVMIPIGLGAIARREANPPTERPRRQSVAEALETAN